MSKILVVTYSFTGTGGRLTELLCRSRNWDGSDAPRPLALAAALDAATALQGEVRPFGLSPEAAG
jgi:hypothetical protein